jgi:putative tryptophan/tyrosine transport system substrate-binding protein
MSEAFRRLWLGMMLILATSGFLLLSDRQQRVKGIPRVAIFQFNSVALLDGGVQGVLDRLKENGFEHGKTAHFERFNAENDMATANSIATELVSGRYDYVVTVSTNCLQAVANANREGRTKHIFGVVADPIVAKVGINPNDPMDHPKHMVGIGSLMPAGEVLEAARQFSPGLKRLGLPWNPSQANSERFTLMARETAAKMGVELLEAAVDNTAAVGETAGSLVSRGADAILILGDLTVALAADAVVAEARKGKIPVLTVMPDLVPHGALYASGIDYYAIGRQMGDLTARVLKGEDTARIPILYDIPMQIGVNLKAMAGLKDSWKIPAEVIAKAKQVIR